MGTPWERRQVLFQYPLTDRGDCNRPVYINRRGHLAWFQYPLTDRGDCNIRILYKDNIIMFQYPLTDRGDCNHLFITVCGMNSSVSVSTNGSRRLQPLPPRTLCRSLCMFQYPLTDRGDCNRRNVITAESPTMFQYPLTDRGDCNFAMIGTKSPHAKVSVSTNGSRRLQPGTAALIYRSSRSVSVSTNGSRRLQLGDWGRWDAVFSAVSVSTNGSRRLQPFYDRRGKVEIVLFQYPLTDRGDCNPPERLKVAQFA